MSGVCKAAVLLKTLKWGNQKRKCDGVAANFK